MQVSPFKIAALAAFFVLSCQADEGREQFNAHCAACHQLESNTVGPSQLELKALYPKNKQQAFLNWTNAPGKIRQNKIQMPAMRHVGNDNLVNIHQYLLSITKPTKIVKGSNKRHNFSFKPPAPTFPYIRRGYMPFSSPAAVGIIHSNNLGINWDASIGKVRYVFKNTGAFFSGESNETARQDDVLYHELSTLWPPKYAAKFDFKGYRIVNNLPVFEYNMGELSIREKVEFGPNSFTRTFQCVRQLTPIQLLSETSNPLLTSNVNQNKHVPSGKGCDAMTLDFTHRGKAKLSASTGSWIDDKLQIEQHQSTEFSITVELLNNEKNH